MWHEWTGAPTRSPTRTALAQALVGAIALVAGVGLPWSGPAEILLLNGLFVVGWLRTEEHNYLSTPPGDARTLPQRSQELLGYAAHAAISVGGGYLGAVDLLDPVELLAQG